MNLLRRHVLRFHGGCRSGLKHSYSVWKIASKIWYSFKSQSLCLLEKSIDGEANLSQLFERQLPGRKPFEIAYLFSLVLIQCSVVIGLSRVHRLL